MLAGQLVLMFLFSAATFVLYLFLKRKKKDFLNKFLKVFSLTIAVVFFFMFMSGNDFLRNTFKLASADLKNPFLTFVALVLNWALYSVVLLVVLFPFFKDSKYATIIKYYGLIVTLLNMGFVWVISRGVFGTGIYASFFVRPLLYGILLGILFGYCLVVFFEFGKFKVSKNDAWGFAYIIGMLLATMPSYMLKALFGELDYVVPAKDFNFPHRLILYFSIIIPIVLFVLLHKKNRETVRGILLYISLGTLVSFSLNYRFANFLTVTNWPFHLCNTAMYIIPLCLIFKWEKLFYFTYFINVFGAFIAMAMPNYATGLNLFSTEIVGFYINHYIAFFMPILIVALGVYKRPRLKQFTYSMIGFGIYFVLALIFNAWFSNYGSVDYFFLNTDFVADKLGQWAEDTRNIVWAFNIGNLKFVFYPLYQFLFFIVYLAIAGGIWFVYESAYNFTDVLFDILKRKQKIKADMLALEVAKANIKGEDMKPTEANIVLDKFTKRYGKSKVYAVKDASLVVKGGEVFGFLGHNGAGKSTIIKSIVGIQPITDGHISVCGFDVEKEAVLAKRNIGYVPDQYALYEKLTGRQYVNYIADLYDVSVEDRNKAIDKYVKLFELENAFDNQIKTYSHGMKQKITIISALVHNPKVWILDEPLTGLDPTSIYQVKQCMKQHAKEGNVVFFSSHLIDVVEQICDRVAIIKHGKILVSKSVKEIKKKDTLENFYLKTTEQDVPYELVKEEVETVDMPVKLKKRGGGI